MKKSFFEKVFGSCVVIAIVVILFGLAAYMKFTDEAFPEPNSAEQNTAAQQEP